MKNQLRLLTLLALPFVPQAGEPAPRPNIVLLMSDDQGWADVGFNGNDVVRTPHLDAMAGAGLRFDRFYAASPLCSPTRGSCLTGRHPFRYGIFQANAGRLPRGELTLAELLKESGYVTGHFGKWHLGSMTTTERDSRRGGPEKAMAFSPPWEHGFDVCFSTEAKVPTYDPMWMPLEPEAETWWSPEDDPQQRQRYHSQEAPQTSYWNEDGEKVEDGLEGDDSRVIMDRVIPFVRDAAAASTPFLAVVWFHAPHKPVVSGPEHAASYAGLDGFTRHYYGCITAMDEQIGRLRAELDELGLAGDTLVWFCSDNGPFGGAGDPGSAGTLRGRKGELLEGGLRVPAVLEWPGRVQPGSTDVPACTSDFLPTLLDLLDVPMPDGRALDGVSLLPLIEGRVSVRGAPLGFQSGNELALIDGGFKLHSKNSGRIWALYDLAADPEETRDLAGEDPARVETMSAVLKEWREECLRDYQEMER